MRVDKNQNLLTASNMLLAMMLFASGDALIKYLSHEIPIGEILFFRGVLVCGFLLALIKLNKQRLHFRASLNRWNLARALCELGVAYTYLIGLTFMPLATATVLIFAGPMLLTTLAASVLKERVGWRRWLAVSLGFVGVLIVTEPMAGNWSWAVILPLLAALLTAVRDILIRYVPLTLGSLQLTFTTAWVVTLGGLLTLPLGWIMPQTVHFAWLSLSAAIICAAYLCYVLATRVGDLSFVSPFKYVTIPFSMLLGYWIWGDTPSSMMLFGACIIIGSGLFIFFRERQLAGP